MPNLKLKNNYSFRIRSCRVSWKYVETALKQLLF